MLIDTRYEHIVLNENNVPMIAGTTMKVQELVAERLAWGWSPEELFLNHPYLTMGQIFSALAYYADHRLEIELAIEADHELAAELRKHTEPSPLFQRLKHQGLN